MAAAATSCSVWCSNSKTHDHLILKERSLLVALEMFFLAITLSLQVNQYLNKRRLLQSLIPHLESVLSLIPTLESTLSPILLLINLFQFVLSYTLLLQPKLFQSLTFLILVSSLPQFRDQTHLHLLLLEHQTLQLVAAAAIFSNQQHKVTNLILTYHNLFPWMCW